MSTTYDSDPDSIIEADTDTATGNMPARPDQVLPEILYLLPLQARPFFPAQVMPILMNEKRWLETVRQVSESGHRLVALVMVHSEREGVPEPQDFYSVGTAVRIHDPVREDDKLQFIAEGVRRIRIVKWLSEQPPFKVQVEYPPETDDAGDEVKAYAMALINTIKELLPLNPLYSEELRSYLDRFRPNDPSPLTDFAAAITTATREELQEVLATLPVLRRMEKVLLLIQKELELARMQAQIRARVEESMSEHQRNFFLREQLKEIQKELGISKDDRTVESERFRKRLERLTLPGDTLQRIDEEMRKFSVLEPGSPEYAVTRNYLDWVTALPWGYHSQDHLDLAHARQVLDRHHDGLADIKDRIIEFLAVGSYRGEISGSILLLVGPPGVGKTSLGQAVAAALGRKFFRFSLGGMRDEAEIKGHRRTYIGAMPGKFIQALKDTGTANPVIMLDEIDKVGDSYQGDPASALLEVLDPEQNAGFLDHYLDLRFDLSKVLFICTANQLDTISPPLLDRLEVIRLPGYLSDEKIAIARRHLWPRQRKKAGVTARQMRITDGALRMIAQSYAREAGVRGLDKQLGRIMRKGVIRLLEGEETIRIGAANLQDFLGQPIFLDERPELGVGMVIGLAWTAMGGATLSVEANCIHRRRAGFQLTGMLGDVMKESANIAYSYVAANAVSLGVAEAYFDDAYIHLHVPEGATPKDGPSAGVTMASALVSLARGRRIARTMAMTGELTLTGKILAVGGIREKLIAARRNRIMEVILPQANRRDFDELPESVRKGMKVHFVASFHQLLERIFT